MKAGLKDVGSVYLLNTLLNLGANNSWQGAAGWGQPTGAGLTPAQPGGLVINSPQPWLKTQPGADTIRESLSTVPMLNTAMDTLAGDGGQISGTQVEQIGESGIISLPRFNTLADPMREVTGAAEKSHPMELEAYINDLASSGVPVTRRDGAIAYSPAITAGMPGEMFIEEGASFSAWAHEYKHFCDDRDDGFLGFRVFADSAKCIQREWDAYQVEIEMAKEAGRSDIVKRLEDLRDKEIKKYENNK